MSGTLDAHHVSWRWYSFDRDAASRDVHTVWASSAVRLLQQTGLPWKTIFDVTVNPKIPSFLEDVAAGTLRQVSWINPSSTNFNLLGFPVNDDHPPADIKDGRTSSWPSTTHWRAAAVGRSLLVIVYDENGGFYDHVPPQAADDEPEMFGKYGVRVPAIIISPSIEPRSVSHTLFDHTSIIKTILSRFCPKALNEPQQAQGRARQPGLKPQYPGLRMARPIISGNY